jgi:hypothetical protein
MKKNNQHLGQARINDDYGEHRRTRERLRQHDAIGIALDFLKKLRPRGPWVLIAIKPDGPIKTITARNENEVRDFVGNMTVGETCIIQ